MVSLQPHFLLFSRADCQPGQSGAWHFLLESMDGQTVVEASDREPALRGERLELLAVVRGLEALDQPSRVTLVTASRRIARGFRYGLDEWRQNDWQWERDGLWVPIKNGDLWRRVDRALAFHQVTCRTWHWDAANNSRHREPERSGGVVARRRPTRMRSVRPLAKKRTAPLTQRLAAAVNAFFDPADPAESAYSWSGVQ